MFNLLHLSISSIDKLHILFILAGIIILIVGWDTIVSGIKKKKITGNAALVVTLGICVFIFCLIVIPLIFVIKDMLPVPKTTPKSVVVHPSVLPYPGGDVCLTGNATGATGTKVFQVSKLSTDGKTDNYKSIQSAIDEAADAGGGIVKLPAGVFMLNGHITMKDNVALAGVGSDTVLKAGLNFLKNTEEVGYSIISTKGASNVTIAHLTADQQGNILNGNAINRFKGYVIYVYKSHNVIVDDVMTRNPFAYAIMTEESSHFCIKHNDTQVNTSGKYDQLDGIHVLNSAYGDVLSNYVDQGHGDDGDDGLVAHTIDGTVHDVTYAGNKVRGGKGGSGMQMALTNSTDTIYNIKIQNNEFWNSPRGIRTGYYGEKDGSVHDILIGGSAKTGNYIHDNIFNNAKTGDAVNIYGNGIDPYNITVTYNKACKAGTFSVGKGTKNITDKNLGC